MTQPLQPGETWTNTPGSSNPNNLPTTADQPAVDVTGTDQTGTGTDQTDYTGAGLTQTELGSLFQQHDPQGQASKAGRPYMSAIGTRVKDENGQDQSAIKYTLWDGTHFTIVPTTTDANGNTLKEPVYEVADTGNAFSKTNTTSTQRIAPAGERRVTTKPLGGGVYRITEIADGHGNWTEDPNTAPTPVPETPAERKAGQQLDISQQRADQQSAHYQALDDRYAHAFELQTQAMQASNALKDKELTLTNAVQQGQLSLQEAQFQYTQGWNNVIALQNQAKMELDALNSQQQAALQQEGNDITQRGQDIGAETASENRKQQGADTAINFAGNIGQSAAQTALGSLPFIAPVGTAALMARNREALANGQNVGDQSLPAMAFPFDPTKVAQDAANSVVAQMPWMKSYMQNGPQAQQIPPQSQVDWANTPAGAALANGAFQAPTPPATVTPAPVTPVQPTQFPTALYPPTTVTRGGVQIPAGGGGSGGAFTQ